MTKRVSILAASLTCLFISVPSLAHEHHSSEMDKVDTPSGDSVFNLKSHWKDQNGKEFALEALTGHSSVVTMTYTHCKSSCPVIVEEMKKIENEAKSKSLRFVLISFDSKRDTPAELKKFSESRKLDSAHWLLLNGNASAVRELAAVLGVRYREDEQGEFDHSNVISLLDSKGVVRYQKVGLGGSLETIVKNAKALAH